ncbi:hypothetical protein [Oceanospirillum sp.]|uniref:hypothetical protein n=1 Tax=Oceanospirillum sp. TaxID=2021254 RepID=UPI003A951863
MDVKKISPKPRELLYISIPAIVILLIVGWFLGYLYGSKSELSVDSASSWLAAIATAGIAILTFYLAAETIKLRELNQKQIDQLRLDAIKPDVMFALNHNPAAPIFFDFFVSNTGKGTAFEVDLSFEDLSPDHSAEAYKFVVQETLLGYPMLKEGIKSLGTSEERTSSVAKFSFPDLIDKFGDDAVYDLKFHIEINYTDSEGNPYTNHRTICFREFEGITLLGEPSLNKIAKEFEKFNASFKPFSTGHNKPQVITWTQRQLNEYHKDIREKMEKIQAKKNDQQQ